MTGSGRMASPVSHFLKMASPVSQNLALPLVVCCPNLFLRHLNPIFIEAFKMHPSVLLLSHVISEIGFPFVQEEKSKCVSGEE